MDFIVGFPRSRMQHVYIWVIVDRMTKSALFLPVKTTYSVEDYAMFYLEEVVLLHGCKFWKSFQKGLGSKVNLSILLFIPRQMVKQSALFRL